MKTSRNRPKSNTFEETIKIVVPNEEALPGAIYEIDTIITFDAETFEETMEIVKTRVVSAPQQKNIISKKEDGVILFDNTTYQIDTIK